MYDVEIEESMGRISKDEQRVLNEKAEEIKKIICNEKISWNQLYPKIVKTIVVTFLELRLDSIFKRLGIPELPDDYMGKYYNRIASAFRFKVSYLNDDYECDIARNWLRASFYNDNRYLNEPEKKSLQEKFTELKEKLNRRIDDLKINLDYKIMLVNFNFPKSLQRKYARLGWFLSKKVLNDNFRRSLNLELRIRKTRSATSTLSTVRELEFSIHKNLFPEEIFPKNSIWSIFYIFKFNDSKEEIDNLIEFKRSRKMKNLIAIRPIFKIRAKNEGDSEIITLEDFLEKESVKIEDCQIEINEEYKDPNKTKYKKDYEVDYKDLMNIWYWECVKRNDLERALKTVLTSVKMNDTSNESREKANGLQEGLSNIQQANGLQEGLSNIQQAIISITSDKQSGKKSKVFEGYEHNKRPYSWEDVTICYLKSYRKFFYFKDYLRPLRISKKRHSLLEMIIKSKDNLILGHYTHNSDLFHRLNEYLRLGFKKEDRPMDWKRYQKVFKVSFNVKMKEEINDLKIILKSPEEIEKRSNDTY